MELQTSRLYLRRMIKSDFEFFVTLTQDSVILKYFGTFNDIDNYDEFFQEKIINKQNHGNLFLVICTKQNDMPIGILDAISTTNSQWLLEYALLQDYRHQGYISELLTYICLNDYLFLSVFKTNRTSISSLLFEVKHDNIASKNVLYKLASTLNLTLHVGKIFFEIIL